MIFYKPEEKPGDEEKAGDDSPQHGDQEGTVYFLPELFEPPVLQQLKSFLVESTEGSDPFFIEACHERNRSTGDPVKNIYTAHANTFYKKKNIVLRSSQRLRSIHVKRRCCIGFLFFDTQEMQEGIAAQSQADGLQRNYFFRRNIAEVHIRTQ
jgi:hypothetical protein